MGTFNKLKKSSKFSHLDEKIEFLNKELKKTGVVCEAAPANSTAGIYNIIDFTPGLPEIRSDVPDSTGFSDGSSTQDANGGDESDSDTWENGWNNITDMKNPNNLNGETNRNIPFTPDLSGWSPAAQTNKSSNDPIGSGYGGIATWSISSGIGGGKTIGTITAGNTYVGMVVPDNIFSTYNFPRYPRTNRVYAWYSDSEYQAANNIAVAYEANKTKLWVTRKVWVPYDIATSHGGPSYAEYTGAKKTTTITDYDGNSVTKQWKLKEISVLAGTRQNYISQNSTPDISNVIFSAGLDNGEYYPGPTSGFMDFLKGALGVGKQALDWLADKAGEVVNTPYKKLQDAIDGIRKIAQQHPVGEFGIGVSDGLDTLYDVVNVLKIAEKNGDIVNGKIKEGALGSITNPMLNEVSDTTAKQILKGVDIGSDKMGKQIQKNVSAAPGVMGGKGTIGAKGVHNNLPGMGTNDKVYPSPTQEDDGSVEVPDTYAFRPGGFRPARYSPTGYDELKADMMVGVVGDIANFMGQDGQEAADQMATMLDQALPFLKDIPGKDDPVVHFKTVISKEQLIRIGLYNVKESYLSEGWESPKHTYVDKNQQKRWFKEKDVAPVYPKKAPPKLVRGYHPALLPKLDTPIPQIKVRKKDLLRGHHLKKDEAQRLIDLVDRLNDYIKRNPDMLAYARERYPVSDPHLAALNYKMDMQLAAADEYIEKQFPENIRLYNKVVDATKKSIKLTDPKTFKSEKGVFTTFNKLARVQHVDNLYQPKERTLKLKKRGKNSVNRFLSKPKEKTKDDILKDKLAVLDKEMQKTMPDT